jgi:hypothetical protein
MNHKKQKNVHSNDEKGNVEDFRILIQEQTETIIGAIKDQYTHSCEVQQKQHNEQMDIFKQFLMKF